MSALKQGITEKPPVVVEEPIVETQEVVFETSFKQIYENVEKEYHFRIKSLVDLSERIDEVTKVLEKYDVKEISKVQKTIFQRHPLDFSEFDAAEVWIVDVTTRFPITPYVLMLDLAATLDISENFIIVRSDNEPTEVESNKMVAITDIEAKEEPFIPSPVLSTDPLYPENSLDGKLIVGNEYNSKFLDFLAQQANVRAEASVVKTGQGLFAWIEANPDEHADSGDFNADIKDAPKVKNRWDHKTDSPKDTRDIDKFITHHGNLDDDAHTYTLRVEKPSGAEKEISKTVKPIR